MKRDATLDTLNKLIETSKDGEYGFRTAAECVSNGDTRQLLMRRADECQQAAAELQTLVVKQGGKAEDSGSAVGAMHRGWITVKSKLSSFPDRAILEETEDGEDVAMESYRKALATPLPDDIRGVVERQYEGVKRNHLQIRALRDQARATADSR